jgi:hypothetical protein
MNILQLSARTLLITISFGLVAAFGDMPTDAQVTAHRSVLDLAGAFTNDGFKLRDGDFSTTLKAGQSTVVQVNLYAGNEYWFAVSTSDAKSAVTISVYDEAGKVMKTEPYASQADETAKQGKADAQTNPDPDANSTNRAAAGFAPDASGPYYVKIANTTGAPATCCLIYSYK